MTAAPGQTSRGPGVGHSRQTRAIGRLAILLAAGFGLRILLAYVLFPGSGFRTDIGTFTAWALTLAEHGPGGFYEAASFADYPPGYLYVLWLVGGLANLLAGLTEAGAGAIAAGLIKLPPMLADVAIAAVLFLLVREWARARPDGERLALLAAAIYLFNPVTWYDSAIWGQTDAVGALVMLLGVAALVRGNSEGAAGLAVLAALVKPQFGVVFAPLVGVILLRRHLLAPGSGPRHRPLVPGAVRAWFEEERGVWRLLSSAVVGMLVLFALITPFSLDLSGFIRRMAETAGGYEYLSVNAYNLWALVGAEERQPFVLGGGWSPDTAPLLGPLPGVAIGAALLLAGFLAGLARVGWRDDRRSIVVVAVLLSLAFFVLPTRVHERYLFPVFALLPLLAVVDRRWLWATAVLSLASFINLHGVLTNPLYATPNIEGLPLGALFREPLAIVVSAVLHSGVFVFVLWHLRPAAAARPDLFSDGSAEDATAGDTSRPVPAGGMPLALALTDLRQRLERWTDVVPLRRDRSSELVGERGGRIGRLDVLLLLIVFLGTLGVRTVRLEEPYAMHFDEVYHARTGIEFLQHWQYGMPHTIYEYTHPHLAKYAMAVGIVTLGNNRVTEMRELGEAARAAAVERRWSPREAPGERNGDRLFVATGTELLAFDLANLDTPTRVASPATTLAVDEDEHVLYLGDSAGGLWRMDTAELDVLRHTGRAVRPPSLQPLAELGTLTGTLAGLTYAAGRLVALSSEGELVTLDPVSGEELGRVAIAGAAAVIGSPADSADALIVGAQAGFVVLDAETLDALMTLGTDAPVTGMALVTEGVEQPTIYGAVGASLQAVQLPSDESPTLGAQLDMPNVVTDVIWNGATTLVHALGRSPDGSQAAIYLVEPRSNAVFADARLPFEPDVLVLDSQPQRPAEDRADLLALDADGTLARVDAGSNAFAWRFPGVLVAALMAALIFLLARILFARRSVAVIASLLVLVDGMFFANARIAMNDTYVAFFIVAALTLFAPLWLRRWRSGRAVLVGLIGVGVLLGLALASKWVAVYAIGAVGLLILLRSALGRLLALMVMILLAAVLGYIAITPEAGVADPQLNYLFLLLMVGLTLALAVGMTLRPVRMTPDEMRLSVFGPAVPGIGLLAVGAALLVQGVQPAEGALLTPVRLIYGGAGLIVLANVIYISFRLAGRYGFGPLAPHRAPEPGFQRSAPPPPRGWLRPGSGRLGLSWLLAIGAVTVIPLVIYTASYLPWIELGNRWTAEVPAGHGGQLFLDLQRSMYDYHNYLRATHPASSPWWAWPLNLKPVWFEQEGYANDTTAVIYNTGNLVIFWLAIPAVAWVAYQAWRRRSLALTFLVIAIASLWLPWARIDRVAFQYHIFTTLPFSFLALAYFLGELWHGPSGRTWLLARLAAATAIVAPALLWLLRLPLCGITRVETVNPGSEVCGALNRQLVVTDVQVVGVLIAAAALAVAAMLLWMGDGVPEALRRRRSFIMPLALIVMLVGLVLTLAGALIPARPVLEAPLRAPELPALLALLLLAVPAYYVLRARDARRYVIGALVAAGMWFLLWYPNFGGLPVPSRLAHVHLGLLPTWNYAFQFGANQDEPNRSAPELVIVALLASVMLLLVLAVAQTVRTWRAERAAEQSLRTLHEAG